MFSKVGVCCVTTSPTASIISAFYREQAYYQLMIYMICTQRASHLETCVLLTLGVGNSFLPLKLFQRSREKLPDDSVSILEKETAFERAHFFHLKLVDY